MKNKGKNIIATIDIYMVKCKCNREFIIVLNGKKWECACGHTGVNYLDFNAYRLHNRTHIYGHGAMLNQYFNDRPFTNVIKKE